VLNDRCSVSVATSTRDSEQKANEEGVIETGYLVSLLDWINHASPWSHRRAFKHEKRHIGAQIESGQVAADARSRHDGEGSKDALHLLEDSNQRKVPSESKLLSVLERYGLSYLSKL
jgi:hypothetical protein